MKSNLYHCKVFFVKGPCMEPTYTFLTFLLILLLSGSQLRGSLNKFPDFFHMGTFIDSTHMKL